jgi:L-aminopeptidase/D-esterase-like protein
VGDIRDPQTGALIAGARTPEGRALRDTSRTLMMAAAPAPGRAPGRHEATTIGVVATDAALDKVACTRLARVAHDGLARAIDPVHTAWDGDTLFALSTGHLMASPLSVSPLALEVAAAWVTARATVRAVRSASRVVGPGVPDIPALSDLNRSTA